MTSNTFNINTINIPNLSFNKEGFIILPQSIINDLDFENEAKAHGMTVKEYRRYLEFGTIEFPLFLLKRKLKLIEEEEDEKLPWD